MIEVTPIQCIIWIGTGRAGGRIFVIETRELLMLIRLAILR